MKTKLAIIALTTVALTACGPAPQQPQMPQVQPQMQPQVVAAPAQAPVVVQQDSGFDAGSAALGAMAGYALSGGGSRGSDYDRGYRRAPVSKTVIVNKTVVQKNVTVNNRQPTFASRFASSKSSSRVSLSKSSRRR